MEITVDPGRIRHRQGSASVVNGVPYSNRDSTLALLPGAVVGRWLADNADSVSGILLDLGAGNQPFKVWYSGLAEKCVAVDVARVAGLDVLSMAAPLPFASASFDTVLCTSVLEHVHDAEAVVSEIARILKPGGRLIITIPFLYPTHEAPYDFWRTTHWGLRSVLTRHGLEVDTLAAQGGPVLLVAHYLIGGVAQLVMLLASRLGRFGTLIDNPMVRAALAAPQDAVRSRLSYRLTRFSRAASLGYMAVAHKPS
ncbi:MAG: class I SAM-dependent methyltransferase [Actinomycetota bacterium]